MRWQRSAPPILNSASDSFSTRSRDTMTTDRWLVKHFHLPVLTSESIQLEVKPCSIVLNFGYT
uniref:Uncharacterized protein n=1 Tax=Arundo donax TaxID=35708 RepID=A0A0A9A6E0_ARUDO